MADLLAAVGRTGLSAVQLHLDPIRRGDWDLARVQGQLGGAGVTVLSGMMTMAGEDYTTLDSIRRTGGVRPDATWEANLEAARGNAVVARRLGVRLVTFHAGFIPEDNERERAVLTDRLAQLARVFADEGVGVALETGQEGAETLVELLGELGEVGVGVNFDPANMILYGSGDPIAALRTLRPFVRQVHLKDAVSAGTPGEWGTEVPCGTGAVDWSGFFEIVRHDLPGCDLVIEREQGEQRIADVVTARRLVEETLGVGT